jgi:hypothetical protein
MPFYRLKGRKLVTADGEKIYRGAIIECQPDEIEGFKDQFELVEGPNAKPKPKLWIKARQDDPLKFDVVHPLTGMAINTKALNLGEANYLLDEHQRLSEADFAKFVEEANKPAEAEDEGGKEGAGPADLQETAEAPKPRYVATKRGATSWYDVIDTSIGQAINEKALKAEDAEAKADEMNEALKTANG